MIPLFLVSSFNTLKLFIAIHLFKMAQMYLFQVILRQATQGHGLRELLGVGIGIRNECLDDLEVIPSLRCSLIYNRACN